MATIFVPIKLPWEEKPEEYFDSIEKLQIYLHKKIVPDRIPGTIGNISVSSPVNYLGERNELEWATSYTTTATNSTF